MIGRRAWAAYAIVFVASAGTLVLEIAAGRLLASYFGVSLYTWTSIIGVVLAGISVGNYLGGTVADLAGTRRTLGLVLATAGMASLAILPFTTIDLLGLIPRALPLVARMVLATGILFFAPSALLGMVSPLVVKLTLANLGHAGHVVGTHLRLVDPRQHRGDAADGLRADPVGRHPGGHLRCGRGHARAGRG